ncbi:MAG TPA: hypothetical protein VFB07_00425 [Vicinamibacterales bacterium]|nr:hypothetical protein [Vicinamibacterales bacterium]
MKTAEPTAARRMAALWIIGCVSFFMSAAPRAEVIDRILAVVGGDLITLTDVTAARDLGLQTPGAAADPTRAILSKLIDRELVLAEVERYGPPEPATAAIDAQVRDVRARFASTSDYVEALQRSGIDEAHLRETLRQDLLIREYEDQRFARAGELRQTMIDEWIASLRRRATIADLYGVGR